MPLLDVSDILLDPDFVDLTLVCVRQTQSVDANGRASNAQTTIPFSGVVTMDRGSIMNRVAEGAYISGSILIYSQFNLQMAGSAVDSDLVNWHGEQYTVMNVGDYSAYGVGFTWAVGQPIKPAG